MSQSVRTRQQLGASCSSSLLRLWSMKALLGLKPARSKKRVPPNANAVGWTPEFTMWDSLGSLRPKAGILPLEQVIWESRSDQDGSLFSHLGSHLPSLLPHPVDQACNSVGRTPQGHVEQKGGTLGAILEAASHTWQGTLCLSTLLALPGEFQISLVPRHLSQSIKSESLGQG